MNAAAKEYDGQNKYLRITDIDDTSRQFVSADITSPDANLAEADNYRLSDGDVLFARTGASVGKTYLYKKSDGLVYFAGFLIRAKIKESVSAGFIFQNTLTRSYERYIAITSQRSGQPGVNAQEYAEYQLMLPELFEQEKIAKLLEALDTLITLHQRKYEKLVNIKKSMLDKMFPPNGASVPEIRFKGFTDPWEQRKISELAEKTYGGGTPTTSNEAFWNGNIPWIQSSDIVDGKLMGVEPRKYITQTGLNSSATQLVPKDSIAIITRVGVGKLAYMPFSYSTSQDFLSLSKLNTEPFFTVYACYKKLQSELNTVQGTSIKGITKDELLAKTISVPVYSEQKQIGSFFIQLDTLITLHQREHIKPILEVKRVKRNE